MVLVRGQLRSKETLYYIAVASLFILVLSFSLYQLFGPEPQRPNDLVRVGVVDSGCNEYQDYVVDYRSFIFQDNGYPFDEASGYDAIGHGTEVCRLIHSEFSSVNIYSAKVAAYNGYISYDGVIKAVQYLVEEAKVDIINLSLGGPPYYYDSFIDSFTQYNNILFVAAAGNQGISSDYAEGLVDWPANLPNVIGVSAVDLQSDSKLSSYSSRGRTANGNWVVEFVDDGESAIGRGTSFAAPRITGKFAKLIDQYRSQEIPFTVSSLSATMAKYSSNNLEFNSETGWGRPYLPENIQFTNDLILLEHPNMTDPLLRYSGEIWTEDWKVINSTEFRLEDFQISGNGSEFVKEININSQSWGVLLTVDFEVNQGNGTFTIQFDYFNGNTTHAVQVASEQNMGRVLLDHRNSVEGYSHPYGEFSELEKQMRNSGYIVEHLQKGYASLDSYDLVMVTNYGQSLSDASINITREYDAQIFQSYEDYVLDGGNISFFLNTPQNTNPGYISSMNNLGADFVNTIPAEQYSTIVSNFSDSAVLDGVSGLFYSGSEITPMNSSVSSLGWYKYQFFDGVNVQTSYRSIGVEGSLGSGDYWIFGSTLFLTNQYYHQINQSSNKLINNFLSLV